MSELVLSQVKDHVATITLNRPEARNALSHALLVALNDALRRAAEDAEARVVVLTGAGEVFCAGGDLSAMGLDLPMLEAHQARAPFVEFFRLMAHLGKPTLAAVNGHALGGGLGLAIACDIVIAAERATFGCPEIKVGLFPYIAIATLFRNIGRKKGMELILTGDSISAPEAERIGLVNQVVPNDQFAVAVEQMVQRLAKASPAALKLGRDAVYATQDLPFEQALEYLHYVLTLGLATEDARAGIKAFLEKRKPEWKGK